MVPPLLKQSVKALKTFTFWRVLGTGKPCNESLEFRFTWSGSLDLLGQDVRARQHLDPEGLGSPEHSLSVLVTTATCQPRQTVGWPAIRVLTDVRDGSRSAKLLARDPGIQVALYARSFPLSPGCTHGAIAMARDVGSGDFALMAAVRKLGGRAP